MDEKTNDSTDDSAVREHIAMEAISAIERKDTDAFLTAINVLISDILEDMRSGAK